MWPAIAALGGAYLGYKGTKSQNIASAQQAERSMEFERQQARLNRSFQERMSGSAHQRQVADMRAAGLNPILSATGGKGASTPTGAKGSGAMAPQYNKYQVALQNASTAANIQNIDAQTKLTDKKAELIGPMSTLAGELETWIEDLIEQAEDSIGITLPRPNLGTKYPQDTKPIHNKSYKPIYTRGRRTYRSKSYDPKKWFTAEWHPEYQEGYRRTGSSAKQKFYQKNIPRYTW